MSAAFGKAPVYGSKIKKGQNLDRPVTYHSKVPVAPPQHIRLVATSFAFSLDV